MAEYKLICTGAFISRNGTEWKVNIHRWQEVEVYKIRELTFPADEPIIIEWQDTAKEEVIQGSMATIKVISNADREFIDLYSVEQAEIKADIYKNGTRYWSGTLDTEFYEEPYHVANGYEVVLTFSDFGILDRLIFQGTGLPTLQDIALTSIQRAGLPYTSINETLISTEKVAENELQLANTGLKLSDIKINSANFYDEEGEASTLKETIEAILQPLALRMVQRAGEVLVYDLNALHGIATSEVIKWDGDSSTLGVDKVANSVRLTFSPYADAKLLKGDEIKPDKTEDSYEVHVGMGKESPQSFYMSETSGSVDVKNLMQALDKDAIAFQLHTTKKGRGKIHERARYFRIQPAFSGQEEEGVLWTYYIGRDKTGGKNNQVLSVPGKPTDEVVLQTPAMTLPTIANPDKHYIRFTQELLIDPRYNYFEKEDALNEEYNYGYFKSIAWAFIPVLIELKDDKGEFWHYENYKYAMTASVGTLKHAQGDWVKGRATFGLAWIAYYENDAEDLHGANALNGWKKNHHCIGRPDHIQRILASPEKHRAGYTGDLLVAASLPLVSMKKLKWLFPSFKKINEGELIPYPPIGGELTITVQAGFYPYRLREDYRAGNTTESLPHLRIRSTTDLGEDGGKVYRRTRWIAFKSPIVEIVRHDFKPEPTEIEDIEHLAYIQREAKEELHIDTKCGTTQDSAPTARGVYRWADGRQLHRLKRKGIIDSPERLLLRTICSQYAERRTTLKGEVKITGGLTKFKDPNQRAKYFMMKGEVQDLITDTSETTFVELTNDYISVLDE